MVRRLRFAEFSKLEEQDLPVNCREPRDGATYDLSCFYSLQGFLRRFELRSEAVQIRRCRYQWVTRFPPVQLHYFVGSDFNDPGAKLSFGPEAPQMTPSFEEYFLNQVIFVASVLCHGPDPRSDCRLMPIDQDVKALGLAGQSQFDQSVILEPCRHSSRASRWVRSDKGRKCLNGTAGGALTQGIV